MDLLHKFSERSVHLEAGSSPGIHSNAAEIYGDPENTEHESNSMHQFTKTIRIQSAREREVQRESSDRESEGTRAPGRSSSYCFRTNGSAKSETSKSHGCDERKSIASTAKTTAATSTSLASSSFPAPLLFVLLSR